MNKVGLYYDKFMERHKEPTEKHYENPKRTSTIWEKLNESRIVERCVLIKANKATDEHLLLVHTPQHIQFMKKPKQGGGRQRRDEDVYFNDDSSTCARLAAGGAIEIARLVADEELSCGFAVVRPPGHHAESHCCMGFCLYNNVAVAASFLLQNRAHSVGKILIVDWDIHHGNGTQRTFYDDDRVLYFSIHRYGNKFYPRETKFYPCTEDGSLDKIGDGNGAGFNINVPWEFKGRSNADYLAVWDHVLLPVAREFKPDIVLVSAGFDAAKEDPLGDCDVTAEGYAVMLKKLRELAGGKVVLVLEGGYHVGSLSDCVLACVEVLTQDKEFNASHGRPHGETYDLIKSVREKLSPYWAVLADEVLPEEVLAVQEQQDSFMDEDPVKARKAAVRIASRLVPPAARSNTQVKDKDGLCEDIVQKIAQLQLLGQRVSSKKTADRPESIGS